MILLKAFARGFNRGRLGELGKADLAQAVGGERSADALGIACGDHFARTGLVPILTPPQLRALVPTEIGQILPNVGEIESYPYQGTSELDVQGAIYVQARKEVGNPLSLVPVWLWRPTFGGVSWRLEITFEDPIAQAVMNGQPLFYAMDPRDVDPEQRCFDCEIAADDGVDLFRRDAADEESWGPRGIVCARCAREKRRGFAIDREGLEVEA